MGIQCNMYTCIHICMIHIYIYNVYYEYTCCILIVCGCIGRDGRLRAVCRSLTRSGYIYIYIHIPMHIRIHMYVYTYKHMYIYIYR